MCIRDSKITNKIGTGAIELEKGAHLPIGMGITGAGGLNISGIVTVSAADIDDFLDVGSNIKLGNAGVITATSFSGSGAALTGIDATALKDSAGNVKIQAQASGAMHTGIHTFTSDATFSGNVSIGGTLTYEDVTNIDSVGVVTARAGLKVTGGTSYFAGAIAAAGAITGTASTANVGVSTVTTPWNPSVSRGDISLYATVAGIPGNLVLSSDGSIGVSTESQYQETIPGWLTGRRPTTGQLYPRGVFNK